MQNWSPEESISVPYRQNWTELCRQTEPKRLNNLSSKSFTSLFECPRISSFDPLNGGIGSGSQSLLRLWVCCTGHAKHSNADALSCLDWAAEPEVYTFGSGLGFSMSEII